MRSVPAREKQFMTTTAKEGNTMRRKASVVAYGLLCGAVLLLVARAGPAMGQGAALTAKEQLGKSIFFDVNLSINQNQSCAACHGPEAGWTGPDSVINAGGAVY